MKLLTISDVEMSLLYSSQIRNRFGDVDLIVSCGDLPYYYLEYIQSMLDAPLYYVLGNHANQAESTDHGQVHAPPGGINLHRKVVNERGLLIAGVEGSILYNYGPRQYSQGEMWTWVLMLIPRLMINKILYGRYLDVFITHAPPWHIHDLDDRPHQGIKAFRWFIQVFQPQYHFHGHTHVYRPDTIMETHHYATDVINTYGYRVTSLQPGVKPDKVHH
jgi:Icc-related predicted phosphoesterase